jgi:hypothetical protein
MAPHLPHVQRIKRAMRWKIARAVAYGVGGASAMLLVHGSFPTPPPVVAGAAAGILLGLSWFLISWRTHWRRGEGLYLGLMFWIGLVHAGVLVWGWAVAGPDVAAPWYFVQLGLSGSIGTFARLTKIP